MDNQPTKYPQEEIDELEEDILAMLKLSAIGIVKLMYERNQFLWGTKFKPNQITIEVLSSRKVRMILNTYHVFVIQDNETITSNNVNPDGVRFKDLDKHTSTLATGLYLLSNSANILSV